LEILNKYMTHYTHWFC